MAAKLKSQLDEMRRTKELQESQAKESGPTNKRTEETVVLTRTDAAGNVRPLEVTTEREHMKGRQKRQKASTEESHDLSTLLRDTVFSFSFCHCLASAARMAVFILEDV